MARYYRPLLSSDAARPDGALMLAAGWTWFTHLECIGRNARSQVIPATDAPKEVLDLLTRPRSPVAGLGLNSPRLMGIVNVTPDSFSDGGDFVEADAAIAQGRAMSRDGADILDIGGESTRPFAKTVPMEDEIRRVVPVIKALADTGTPISIDTRKAGVAKAAVAAGAVILNDISALDHDPALGAFAAQNGLPICLMHMQGTPETMSIDPRYDNVLLDVYDQLADRIARAEAAGIARDAIMIDPGIGFGKTAEHNLILLRNIALFHGLGCPILLGTSRKRFIDTVADVPDAKQRLPGSLAVALAGIAQGVQITRVHDITAAKQALRLYRAVTGKGT